MVCNVFFLVRSQFHFSFFSWRVRGSEPLTANRIFQRKPHASTEAGLRGCRAVALLSVMAKGYLSVVVQMLRDSKEPTGWRRPHVGGERGVNCEHLQVLVTKTLQMRRDGRHTERKSGCTEYTSTKQRTWRAWTLRLPWMWLHREYWGETGVHGGVVAALLGEMKDLTPVSRH